MPFTPFHMGLALVVKAATRRYFNIPVFAFTQVVIDGEVLFGLAFRGDLSNHSVLHTIAGGTFVVIIAVLLLRPVIQPGARLWNYLVAAKPGSFLHMETRVPLWAAIISALTGGLSHVILDATTHSDIAPFAPLTYDNPLFDLLSPWQAIAICLALGAVGGGCIIALCHLRRRRT